MDPVDEFARLEAEIRRLQDHEGALRAVYLKPGVRLRSSLFQVTVKRQKRHEFLKERLPEHVLDYPQDSEERETEVVTCNELSGFRAGTRIPS